MSAHKYAFKPKAGPTAIPAVLVNPEPWNGTEVLKLLNLIQSRKNLPLPKPGQKYEQRNWLSHLSKLGLAALQALLRSDNPFPNQKQWAEGIEAYIRAHGYEEESEFVAEAAWHARNTTGFQFETFDPGFLARRHITMPDDR